MLIGRMRVPEVVLETQRTAPWGAVMRQGWFQAQPHQGERPLNIFATDPDPCACAIALDNKRVIKPITECGQMLCTAVQLHGATDHRLWKLAWAHHPMVLWASRTQGNWHWLFAHANALVKEYEYRYGSKHKHAGGLMLPIVWQHRAILPTGGLQPHQNGAVNKERNLDFRDVSNVYQAYQLYLSARWRLDVRSPIWTPRQPPLWA